MRSGFYAAALPAAAGMMERRQFLEGIQATQGIAGVLAGAAAVVFVLWILQRIIAASRRSPFRPVHPEKPFLLAADIDDTLLGDDGGEADFRAFIRDHSGSVLFAVITGRSITSVRELIRKKRLPSPDFILGSVGTELVDCRDARSGLRERYAAQAPRGWDPEAIYALGEGEGIRRQTYPHGQPRFQAGFDWDGRPDTLQDFLGRMKTLSGCHIVASYGKYIDVLPARIGKGEAVKFLQRELDIDPDRVVVAGDSGNDREMFETAFKGILPATAKEELERVVDPDRHYQSPLPAARGVLDGLRHFGFLERA